MDPLHPLSFIRAPALQASAAFRPGREPRSTRRGSLKTPFWRVRKCNHHSPQIEFSREECLLFGQKMGPLGPDIPLPADAPTPPAPAPAPEPSAPLASLTAAASNCSLLAGFRSLAITKQSDAAAAE